VAAVQSTRKRFCCLARRGPGLCLALAFALVGLVTPSPTQTEAQTGAQTQTPLATICVEAKLLGHPSRLGKLFWGQAESPNSSQHRRTSSGKRRENYEG
jgi:hypothetical protein